MKPGSTKLLKKGLKLPFLNPVITNRQSGDPPSEEVKSDFLKNTVIGKYQQYTQVYSQQI
jgi:hypothetical protein